jgi:hypothetical protein
VRFAVATLVLVSLAAPAASQAPPPPAQPAATAVPAPAAKPAAAPAPAPIHSADEQLAFGRCRTVTLYRQTPEPRNVVLFVSGDGGWNQGAVDMARTVASLDALVIGIDIRNIFKELHGASEACTDPASDFEGLSRYVQKQLHYSHYVTPLLVGYSSGATLVYAVLVQAPPGTFAGAISLGFCPDLNLSKPMCRGHGLESIPGPKGRGFLFLPTTTLEQPWIAFQGALDQVCDPAATQAFVDKTTHGEVVMLPKVGHGYLTPRNWEPQLKEAILKLTAPPVVAERPEAVSDPPLAAAPASLDKEVTGAHPPITVPVTCHGRPAVAVVDLARAIARHRLKERIETAGDNDVSSVVTALANILEIP